MTRINLLPHPAATERRLLWAFVRAWDRHHSIGADRPRERDRAFFALLKARKALAGGRQP